MASVIRFIIRSISDRNVAITCPDIEDAKRVLAYAPFSRRLLMTVFACSSISWNSEEVGDNPFFDKEITASRIFPTLAMEEST